MWLMKIRYNGSFLQIPQIAISLNIMESKNWDGYGKKKFWKCTAAAIDLEPGASCQACAKLIFTGGAEPNYA